MSGDLIPWFRTQLEAAKADAEYNAGMSVDAGWNPDRVHGHVEACLRLLDAYVQADQQSRHPGGEVFGYHATGMLIAIKHLAGTFDHLPGYQERWRP